MAVWLTPHEAVVNALRTSGVAGIVWGGQTDPNDSDGNPYYQEAPEPLPDFPYVVYKCPESSLETPFEASYSEFFDFTIVVVGTRAQMRTVGYPWVPGSVFNFLDTITDDNAVLDGQYFDCKGWLRQSYVLDFDRQLRAPSGERVREATALYKMMINATRTT